MRTGRYFGPLDRARSTRARSGAGPAAARCARSAPWKTCSSSWRAPIARRHRRCWSLLSIACYWLMALEVFLVFWAIGQPISLWVGTIVETFTRSASVAGGAIPGNLGALEASNVAVVKALGLAGGGTLALFRRFRSLLFATLGLALYPRDSRRQRLRHRLRRRRRRHDRDLPFDDPGLGQRARRPRPVHHRAARFVVPVVSAGQRPPDHRAQHEVPGAHALLRGHDDARIAGRLLHAVWRGAPRRRSVPAQAAEGPLRRSRAEAVSEVRTAGGGRAGAAAAAGAVQGVRAAGRRRRRCRRGALARRSSSAAASAILARDISRSCMASGRPTS